MADHQRKHRVERDEIFDS